MKTTIELPDPLFQQARRHAERHQMTMKALIEQGLRKVMAEKKPEEPFKLRDASVKGRGLTPEFQNARWEQIRDLIHDPVSGR
ncbi:MAG: hypothetical protein QM772_04290 [Ottowia sp.]|uniref:hypothetical protein n=1 Tax=Ottowia sp. TaxID=1898956 RepID=UPI0039E248BA